MTYISTSSPLYSPQSTKLTKQPFEIGEKVRPHHNFKKYYPDITECTVEVCEKGSCESGWLVQVKEFKDQTYGKQIFDSQWFFKLK